MKQRTMKPQEYKINLWQEFMEQMDYIPERFYDTLGMIAGIYVDDASFLFKVYKTFIARDRFVEDMKNDVFYERDEGDHILSYKGEKCVFDEAEFKRVLVSMLDLLEDTLPLGTVVDLKKSVYDGVAELEKVENIRMVITYRFLNSGDDNYYFPYAGVVYPTGMLGAEDVMYFTRSLVERVLQRGFQDQDEETYVSLMKKELVIEKGKNSFGYATAEEIELLRQQMKGDMQ